MGQYFNFEYLIRKYQTEFTAIIPAEKMLNSAGFYETGEPKQVKLQGAIIGMRESRVISSNGTYTAQDKTLYMLEPLENALKKVKVIHKGNVYSVESLRENAEFTGVYAYMLKYVSVFKDGDTTW